MSGLIICFFDFFCLNFSKLPNYLNEKCIILYHICRVTAFHNRICASSHRRDTTMVALLFSIVIVFLSCHSCKLVLNIYEAAQVNMILNVFKITKSCSTCIFLPRWFSTVHSFTGLPGLITSPAGTTSCSSSTHPATSSSMWPR